MLAINVPIAPGDPGTDGIGWTAGRFSDDSYLWLKSGELWVSLVMSEQPGQGHFSEFVRRAEAAGYRLVVPTPLGRMPAILDHIGFKPGERPTDMGPCEVWARPSVEGDT